MIPKLPINFLDIPGAHQMLPSITLPTRITDTSSIIIDNIFISPTDSNILSGNLTVSISDHLPQFTFLGIKPETSSNPPLGFRRDRLKFNRKQFKNQFENLNWENILKIEESDVNTSFNSFMDSATSLFNEPVSYTHLTLPTIYSV